MSALLLSTLASRLAPRRPLVLGETPARRVASVARELVREYPSDAERLEICRFLGEVARAVAREPLADEHPPEAWVP